MSTGAVAGVGETRRIAFFGGSFDPPHLGHLAVARAAKAALDLDEVLFVPVGKQPLKVVDGTTLLQAGYADRVAMTQLAIEDEAGFRVSLADTPRADGEPNYTIDSLRRIAAEGPVTLYLLMGADAFRLLPRWHEAGEIPFAATLVVVARPGEDLRRLEEGLPAGITARETGRIGQLTQYRVEDGEGRWAEMFVMPDLHYEVSATALRGSLRGVEAGAAALQVTPAVLRYIAERGLYQG